jgi:hypothetical protein
MFSRSLLAASAVGFVAGAVTLVCHIYKRLWTIVALTSACVLSSLLLLVQAAANLNFDMLCEGNAGFVERGALCMVVAGVVVSWQSAGA